MTSVQEVYIASVARTPIGAFQGSLSSLSAIQLGSIAAGAALDRAKVTNRGDIGEVIFGNVLSANLGQAPARQIALGCQIPPTVPCTTVNRVCSSGMKAIILGAQSIALGTNNVVVVGGSESMSNTPYYVPKMRTGAKYGHSEILDGIMKDGLMDVYNQCLMGDAAEVCAESHGFNRDDSDKFAQTSYERALQAQNTGKFKNEIVKVVLPPSKGNPERVIEADEDPTKYNIEKLRNMKSAFKVNGTVTAANASGLNDGAAALVLVSGAYAKEHGIPVLAKILSWADVATDPIKFTTAPSLAIPLALKRAQLSMDQIDYFEINEAFSVVALSNQKILGIPLNKMNLYGGAVAIGHPLGCSGARIVCSLTSILYQESGSLGCAAICNGGGGASALIIQKV